MTAQGDSWPELRYEDYKETRDTLHMTTQIAGKIRLALTPPLAQWAHAPLRLSPDGLTTGPLWVGDGTLGIDLDLIRHEARFVRSDGRRETVALAQPVADFYHAVTETLRALAVEVSINPLPQEVPNPVSFATDTIHATYDPGQANRLWQALIRVGAVYEEFQSGYWGKQSAVSFYWGGFDLGVSRFSGRSVEAPQGLPKIMTGSLDAESFNLSFSFGRDDMMTEPVVSALAYPMPPEAAGAQLQPEQARYVEMPGMGGLFTLRYEDLRSSADPRKALLEFARSAYGAVADLGGWDRGQLERRPPDLLRGAA